MPYRKLSFPPGINREGTQYSAEGNWYDCDLIRFREGRPEKIGGWKSYSANEFLGISRTLMNWVAIDGSNLLAVGTDKKLYVELGGVFYDITPMEYKSTGTLTTPAGINDAVTAAVFDFDVSNGDVIRMKSDSNKAGDELMIVGGSNTAIGDPITISRGALGTVASAHAVEDAAFLLEKINNPVYLIDNSTTALIYYPAHGLTSGDFVNFLSIETNSASWSPVTRDDLYYPAHTSGTTKSTQSFPVTKVLTSDYFEIRIATAPSGTGMSNSALNEDLTLSEADITLTASTPAWAAGDIVKIGDEYIKLGADSGDQLTFTGCLRSQFGSSSAAHSSGDAVNEVGVGASGQGGATIIMRDIQASASTFSEFSGWGAGSWSGIPSTNISSTLNMSSSPLNNSDTSITLTNGASFGSSGKVLIESEIITFTSRSTHVISGGARAQDGTTAASHSNGTSVFLLNTHWTGWGDPTVPLSDESSALNMWSIDSFGEDLVAVKDRGEPYYWNTSLNMRDGYPYTTTSDSSDNYASGICLAAAIPFSSMGLSDDDGHGSVPSEVGFLMTSPASRQVIAFGCSDTFGSYDPLLIRWCDSNRVGSWGVTSQNRAGGSPLQKGSKIVSASRSDRQILVWTDRALYSMEYVGGDDVFNIREIADYISISGRQAHRSGSGVVYWMGDNNFYQFNGQSVGKVNCPIASKVFDELNYSKKETIIAAANSLFNEIVWFYPSGSSTEPDMYALFNYVDGAWAFGSIGRSGWSDAGVREKPNASFNKGPYTSGVYKDIDRSIIYDHEDGYMDDETKMNSYIESGYFDIEEGDSSMFIDKVVPDYRGLQGTSPNISLDIKSKNYPASSTEKTDTVSITPTTDISNTRLRGRTVSAKFYDSGSSTENAGWEIGDFRLRIKQDGRR